ncbi:MAG TPA: DcaP family trimeric outer membrane transporter [Vicinamibacterales bacterium]|nr:DcaP family trimeric outer membrane transporter [Vicinamibacterales bacterium]
MNRQRYRTALRLGMLAGLFALAARRPAVAQQTTQKNDEATLTIYGFGQADAIADFKTNNPDWYDVNRPSKLPSFDGEFGQNGHFYLSPRQSRFGAKATIPTSSGDDIKVVFEFDMFGVGTDAGQTTIRLRHAYGQWKQIGAGQTNSQFMDVDVFPNVLDYWGPNGMLFFRNTQVFWEFYKEGDSNATVAIENPGASGDAGLLSDRIDCRTSRGASRRRTSPVTIAAPRCGDTSRSVARSVTSRGTISFPTINSTSPDTSGAGAPASART